MCTMKWPFSREGWLCPREGRGRKDLEEQHEKEHGSEVSRIWVNPTSLLCHFKGRRGPWTGTQLVTLFQGCLKGDEEV